MRRIKLKSPTMLSTKGTLLLFSVVPRFRWIVLNWARADSRYEKFFYGANDKFEVQRGLNNVFAYDLVPSVKVCEAALRACRRGHSQ
jgi:hypothetical protein